MDSLLGIKGDGFVLMAADASAGRSILVFKTDQDKIMALDSHKLLASAVSLVAFAFGEGGKGSWMAWHGVSIMAGGIDDRLIDRPTDQVVGGSVVRWNRIPHTRLAYLISFPFNHPTTPRAPTRTARS